MLEDNFENYYRGFITTGDPKTIMTSYILDVSKDKVANGDRKQMATLSKQFRNIIGHFEKNSNPEAKKDPRVKEVLKALKENMAQLDM